MLVYRQTPYLLFWESSTYANCPFNSTTVMKYEVPFKAIRDKFYKLGQTYMGTVRAIKIFLEAL